MIAPRSCGCGLAMEWRPRRGYLGIEIASGVYFCAHCDLGCTRAEAACEPCRRMKVKR